MVRRRLSLFSGFAALGLMTAAIGVPGSAAAETPAYRAHAKPAAAAQVTLAPVRQRAVSTAVGIGGDALATASNQNLAAQNSVSSGRRSPLTITRSPSVQTAVGAAISVGGNSAALASNNGAANGSSAALGNSSGGLTKPVPLLELGRAPSTSTAVSTAVSIGGVPISPVR
jgi:hypothetical protein